MKEIPYKYLALGILIGYLSPYVIALLKSYQSSESQEKEAQIKAQAQKTACFH